MKPARLYATLVLASACAGQAVSTPAPVPVMSDTGAPRVMTAEDVIALEAVSDAQISPDGQSVAYVVTRADMTQDASDADVWVVASTGGRPRQLTTSRKTDNAPRWSPDSRRIAFLSARDGRPQLYLMNASGGAEEKLTTRTGAVRQFEWSPDGRSIAYVADVDLTADDERRATDKDDAVVVDSAFRFTRLWVTQVADRTDHPTDHMLATPEGVASDPRWSPDGSRIAYVLTPTPKADDGQLSDIWTSPLAGGAPRRLVDNAGPDHSPRWSPDGQQIAYLTASATDLRQSHLAIIASTGGTPRIVAPDFPFQMSAATWSPDGATLWFNAAVRTTSQQFSVPVTGGMPVARTSVEGSVGAATFSADGRTAAFIQSDMLHPADVYVTPVGPGAFAATRLSDRNPQVRRFLLGRSEVVRWKSTDGLDIDGVLLYPVGYRDGQRYPMVAEIHGGPAGAWSQAFPGSWGNAGHVLAGKGWLVFYPNPRGSSSYGEPFLRANIKDWGAGDYRDIQTGIDALIARGLADSTRLGQSGWSYGGYMTAWTLTQTNRFKALVVGAGLTDMYSMYGTNDLPKTLDNYFGAEPWNDTTEYRRRSAMTFIKQARTPTLILHGQADQRVPIGQSQELYLGLKRNGVPVQLVFYPREPHGLGEPRHQLDKLRREQDWLARYVLGSGETQATLVP
jgi:dipeptidyl aminopeptidase/acylaminoacyl peptidase